MLLWLRCLWKWNAFIIIKTNKWIWRVITDHKGIFRTLFIKMTVEKFTTGILCLTAIFGFKQQLCLCGHAQILLKWGSRSLDWRGGDKITSCQSCQQFIYGVIMFFIFIAVTDVSVDGMSYSVLFSSKLQWISKWGFISLIQGLLSFRNLAGIWRHDFNLNLDHHHVNVAPSS